VPSLGNDAVVLGREFNLESGLMQIAYNTGATVILQGPVTFRVDSRNGGFLPLGRLTGKVEAVAAKGFAVRTPTAMITDLGTEFGVQVDAAGITQSHVFRGSIQVQTTFAEGSGKAVSHVLHENESIRVGPSRDGRGVGTSTTLSPSAAWAQDFIRDIPKEPNVAMVKTLDLVDVVSGGDGFTGLRYGVIDSLTGDMPGPPFPLRKRVYPNTEEYQRILKEGLYIGNAEYHRVKMLRFVDGVFIPGNGTTPVQLDSAGHTYDSFFNSTNMSASYIWAGGLVPTTALPNSPTKLGDIDYLTGGHGLLYMHANKGITFDLEAIRRANPDCTLRRFLAVVANTNPYETGVADAWVFVDGQMRFRRRQINQYAGAFSIDVSLAPQSRFLTLVSTDGGDGSVGRDWITFGDPRLELLTPIAAPH
jgi:hypothetical protein